MTTPCPSPPPTVPLGFFGVLGGQQRRATQTEIALHPEEAGRAQHQVAEAVHLEAKSRLLTATPEMWGEGGWVFEGNTNFL